MRVHKRVFINVLILVMVLTACHVCGHELEESNQNLEQESLRFETKKLVNTHSPWEKISEFMKGILKGSFGRSKRSLEVGYDNQKNSSAPYTHVKPGVSKDTNDTSANRTVLPSGGTPEPEVVHQIAFRSHNNNVTVGNTTTSSPTTAKSDTGVKDGTTPVPEPETTSISSTAVPTAAKITTTTAVPTTSSPKKGAEQNDSSVPAGHYEGTAEPTGTATEITSATASSPEPKVTAEPTPEPERETPQPEVEPTISTSHPEPEIRAPTRKPFAEPVPIWYEAKLAWGPAWEFHVYFVGLAFAVLGLYSIVSIVRLWRKKQLLSRGFFISLNSMLFIMCVFRAVYFLVDGYNSNQVFEPDAVDYFMYTSGFPCLTSAFSILFLALLRTTKVQLLSPNLQTAKVLLSVILGHFVLAITTDAVVGSLVSARAMMFVCQLVSVMWGCLLFGGYFYIFKTLYAAALRRQKDLLKLSLGKLRLPGINPIRKPPRLTLSLGVKITLATSVTGLLYAALQIYAMIGVYGVFSKKIPSPWPWWGFKFSLRILELIMCYLMSYVATQPFRYQKRPNQTACDCFCWAPCHSLCEDKESESKEDSIYWNEIHGVSVSYNQEIDSNDTSRENAAKYMGSPDESLPLSSEEDLALNKPRSNTLDSDYGDIDLGSGPIVLNPHVLYQRNPELLSLRDDGGQNETKLDKNLPIKMPRAIESEDERVKDKTVPNDAGSRISTKSDTKADTPSRKATRPTSLKAFLPKSPIKGNFPFLHSKPEQAGYSNLGDQTDAKRAPVKRSVSESSSSVRTKSHQGSNYLSLSDLELRSGVLDTAECKGQEKIPRSPTIVEETEEGKSVTGKESDLKSPA